MWREAVEHFAFVRKTGFRDAADTIVSQQQFIKTMRGLTAAFSSFNDGEFDETAFEAALARGRMPTMVCWHWVLRAQAWFLSGDCEKALAASDRAEALLWASNGLIQQLDFHYFTALTIAALHERHGHGERRVQLDRHLAQLRDWAEHCSATFQDKHLLVSAEVARLERRELDAERLYEDAIRLARVHGFIQNEGLANELAARFYAARGFETIARAYLRNAKYCYQRWGADGKVRQLDQMHPHLREEPAPPRATSTIRDSRSRKLRAIRISILNIDFSCLMELSSMSTFWRMP